MGGVNIPLVIWSTLYLFMSGRTKGQGSGLSEWRADVGVTWDDCTIVRR